jgi:hypothetical protein
MLAFDKSPVTVKPFCARTLGAVASDRRCNDERAERAEVQYEVGDVRLHAPGEPRRRRHVADRLRAEGVDRLRRGKDRRAREESGKLRTKADGILADHH